MKVFGDHCGAGNHCIVVIDEDRQRAGGVESEQRLGSLPWSLFDKSRLLAVFGKHEADIAGAGG